MIRSFRRRLSGRGGSVERYTLVKNVALLCIAFVLNFTAYGSMQNLQSSLNLAEGLGIASLTTIYVFMVISVLFLPSISLHSLGCKWTIAAGLIPYALYMLANCYATWATIIPASALIGIGGGVLWPAKCQMLTRCGKRYAELTRQSSEVVINKFFSIFFMAFQSSLIWGSLITTFILQETHENDLKPSPISQEQLRHCGATWCDVEAAAVLNNTNLDPPDLVKRYVLCGTFFCLCSLAFVTVSVLLDNMTSLTSPSGRKCTFHCDLAFSTFKHLRHGRQLLLIPLTVYSGLEQGFFAGEFTRSYVSCALGIWVVGLVVLAYATTNTTCCMLLSFLVNYVDRIYFFLTGALLHLTALVTLFVWHPDPQHVAIFFMISALWGAADAIWSTQVNALYGCIFPVETDAAFANYRLWETVGFIVSFAVSGSVCVYIQIYALIGSLMLGMASYYIVERNAAKP